MPIEKLKSLEYDRRYLQAALELMERYLLSNEIFWPLGATPPKGEPDYPQMTLDGVLLARARLSARPKTADQQDQVGKVISDLEYQRSRHRVAWERKARECYRVRMRMWGDFLQEYRDNPGDNTDRYAYEVRLRVMLNLLKPEIGSQNAAEVKLLIGLDKILKGMLVDGGFIWDEGIEAGFPRDEYWYLYGSLPRLAKNR
jgi:hypothetical protein